MMLRKKLVIMIEMKEKGYDAEADALNNVIRAAQDYEEDDCYPSHRNNDDNDADMSFM